MYCLNVSMYVNQLSPGAVKGCVRIQYPKVHLFTELFHKDFSSAQIKLIHYLSSHVYANHV